MLGILGVSKMNGYIDNMDKEREEGGDCGYLCSFSIVHSGVLSSIARTYCFLRGALLTPHLPNS